QEVVTLRRALDLEGFFKNIERVVQDFAGHYFAFFRPCGGLVYQQTTQIYQRLGRPWIQFARVAIAFFRLPETLRLLIERAKRVVRAVKVGGQLHGRQKQFEGLGLVPLTKLFSSLLIILDCFSWVFASEFGDVDNVVVYALAFDDNRFFFPEWNVDRNVVESVTAHTNLLAHFFIAFDIDDDFINADREIASFVVAKRIGKNTCHDGSIAALHGDHDSLFRSHRRDQDLPANDTVRDICSSLSQQ